MGVFQWIIMGFTALQLTGVAAETHPASIQKVIDQKIKECKKQGKGELTLAQQAIQTMKLNQDSVADYLIDESGFECTSSEAMRAGSTPIRVHLYLSEKKGQWKKAWSQEVLAYEFDSKSHQLMIEVRDAKDPLKVIKKPLQIRGTEVN